MIEQQLKDCLMYQSYCRRYEVVGHSHCLDKGLEQCEYCEWLYKGKTQEKLVEEDKEQIRRND